MSVVPDCNLCGKTSWMLYVKETRFYYAVADGEMKKVELPKKKQEEMSLMCAKCEREVKECTKRTFVITKKPLRITWQADWSAYTE